MRSALLLTCIFILSNCSNPNSIIPEPLPFIEKKPKNDRPDLALQQEFEMTKNPILGRPTPEHLVKTYLEIKKGKYGSHLRN